MVVCVQPRSTFTPPPPLHNWLCCLCNPGQLACHGSPQKRENIFTLLLLRSRITSLLALCRSRAHWDCLGLSLGDLHSLGGAPVALPHSAQASSSSPTPVAAAAALAGSLRWPWAEGRALPPFGADNREPGATNETHRATSSSSQVDLSPENAMREHEEKKPLNSVRESTSAVASSGEDS